MKKLVFIMTSFMALSSVYGAPHKTPEGKVTLQLAPSVVQVDIGKNKINEGDQVVIYKETCRGPKVQLCQKEEVGSGVVSKVLNDKTSEVKLDSSLAIEDDYLVEKK